MTALAISAVIPALNEAARLPACLAALGAIPEVVECIVVDADSDDDSAAIARAAGARVLAAPRRLRAAQLNQGAAAAASGVLVFVHADTLLAPVAGARIAASLRDRAVVGGAFRRRFVPASPLLALSSRLGDLRARFSGISFGDQAQFVRRAAFEAVGGFAAVPRAEDMDLARRLRRIGRLAMLGPPVRSSPRRFGDEAMTVSLRDAWLTCRYWRGVEAA